MARAALELDPYCKMSDSVLSLLRPSGTLVKAREPRNRMTDVARIVSNNEEAFAALKMRNRDALRIVESWIPESGTVSHAGYGTACDPIWNIDLIKAETTYSDLLTFLISYLKEPISYLEIGVSVGKNFWQIYNACAPGSYFCGVDAEEINPRLEVLLPPCVNEIEIGPEFTFERLKKTQRVHKYVADCTAEYVVANLDQLFVWKYLAG
jgi:hypothetical protein